MISSGSKSESSELSDGDVPLEIEMIDGDLTISPYTLLITEKQKKRKN